MTGLIKKSLERYLEDYPFTGYAPQSVLGYIELGEYPSTDGVEDVVCSAISVVIQLRLEELSEAGDANTVTASYFVDSFNSGDSYVFNHEIEEYVEEDFSGETTRITKAEMRAGNCSLPEFNSEQDFRGKYVFRAIWAKDDIGRLTIGIIPLNTFVNKSLVGEVRIKDYLRLIDGMPAV